jgi:hypothetical protein
MRKPEGAEELNITSTDVIHSTEPPMVPFAPSVQPVSVTVTAAPAANAVPFTASTMDVTPGGPGVTTVPADDTLALGVGDVAKKPDG